MIRLFLPAPVCSKTLGADRLLITLAKSLAAPLLLQIPEGGLR
jgi:hypothetical protein